MKQITAIITHRDDTHDLQKCLRSLRESSDDIVVIDLIGSKQTAGICRMHKIKYLRNEPSEINSVLDEITKGNPGDYFLLIGSNEYFSGGLKNNMTLHRKTLSDDAYKFIIRKNYYGRWMKHSGLYPNQEIRLIKRNMVTWNGNSVIFEPEAGINTITGSFNGEIYSMVYTSIFDHINQINAATETEAHMLFNSAVRSNFWKIIFSPFMRFSHLFFIKLGFLDGYYGLVNAVISGYYDFLVQVKLKFFRKMD